MDRLISLEPSNEVAIRIEPNQRCSGVLTLRNVMYTMPVAFRLLPLNRTRFSIRPQNGIIAPLAMLDVEVIYLPPPPPSPLLPDFVPESDESFFLDSVVSPGAAFKDGATATSLDTVPAEWFTTKKKQVFTDSAVRVFYVGSLVLFRLVQKGDLDKLREVLERSDPSWCPADSVDSGGDTLLHLAISHSRPDLVQILLEFGANLESLNRSGRSPLETASAAGESLIVELLLARGASKERFSARGPIHHAAAGGQVELLRLLLKDGAAVNDKTADGRTALHLATEERHRESVAMLLAAGARADVRTPVEGNTPLHVAAANGDEAMASLLIAKGCAGLREARNSSGKTAYDIAVEERQRRLFDLLRTGDGLAAVVRRGKVDDVVRAMETGAAVDVKDVWGWTALMRAAFKGKLEVIRVLLEKGAAVDSRDEEGYTALHCAAEGGHSEAVDFLLKRGADVDAKTAKGRTAVEIARSHGYAGIVRILVQGGAGEAPAQMPVASRELPLPSVKGKMAKKGMEKEVDGKKRGRRVVPGMGNVKGARTPGFGNRTVALSSC
ncbi:hypothetical protein HPP92_017087 [Vanilla planifolia]|uniref:MSP domain-containing protein n=1 Tax=Vanilla planifolia TaxID=51239 RepID=A0A835QDU0_VANPL|nr:hypothetical protein HPP92_017087 [Vanilla planifolia]